MLNTHEHTHTYIYIYIYIHTHNTKYDPNHKNNRRFDFYSDNGSNTTQCPTATPPKRSIRSIYLVPLKAFKWIIPFKCLSR